MFYFFINALFDTMKENWMMDHHHINYSPSKSIPEYSTHSRILDVRNITLGFIRTPRGVKGWLAETLENWDTINEQHKFRCDNLKNGSFIHLFE